MKTKNLVSTVAVFLVAMFAFNASAAPKQGKGERLVRGLDPVAKALESVTDLSDEQKTKTATTIAEAQSQLVALRDEAKANKDKDARKSIRQKIQEIVLNVKTDIKAQLTEPQKTSFREALQTARKAAGERNKQNGKNKGGAGNGDGKGNV